MKTSLVTLWLAFAFAVSVYGAEDLKLNVFPKKLDGSGVNNLYQLSDRLYSGSKPNGEDGFRFLAKLGVKTIISVDGTAPDVALASKYGIGYVHVPMSSDAIKEAQALQIMKAAAEQPGPLYVHCHYGMNRGPSASAIICMAQHGWTPEQAVAWMKKAGTSSTCTGLYRDVRSFKTSSAVTPTRTTGAKLTFDTYSGYFVSNKFEPNAADSFVVITDQDHFDEVFGVAFVMGDKSHRLPKDAFKSAMVIAPIKRGKSLWDFKVERVTEAKGMVELRYTTTEKKSDTATFASPLIVAIPKGKYTGVQFVENGKVMKKVEVAINAAKRQIGLLKTPLLTYQLDIGSLPTTAQGLDALRRPPADLPNPQRWAGPYLDADVPLDPWGKPYHYCSPGTHNHDSYDVWSSGPDGINGTQDDIGNW
jgi:type II secretion system protein G